MPTLHQRPLNGRNCALALDQFDVTAQNNTWDIKRDAAAIDVSVFSDVVSDDLAGIQKCTIDYKGFYGSGESGYNQAINTRFGQNSNVYLAIAPGGWLPLGDVTLQPSVILKSDKSAKLKGAVDANISAMARGHSDDGFILFSPNVPMLTTGGVSGVYTSDVLNQTDVGATVYGCSAQLHVFAAAGTTPSLAVKVQASPDGTTWTDIPGMTFVPATAPGVQRLDVLIGNNIDMQIRALATVTGTGAAFNAFVGWARGINYN